MHYDLFLNIFSYDVCTESLKRNKTTKFSPVYGYKMDELNQLIKIPRADCHYPSEHGLYDDFYIILQMKVIYVCEWINDDITVHSLIS